MIRWLKIVEDGSEKYWELLNNFFTLSSGGFSENFRRILSNWNSTLQCFLFKGIILQKHWKKLAPTESLLILTFWGSMDGPMIRKVNTRHRGKSVVGLQFNYIVFDQRKKYVVICV